MKFRVKENRIKKTSRISDLMDSLFKNIGLEKEYNIQFLYRDWENIAGQIISTHTKPHKIYGSVLYVLADHSVFANDLILIKDCIVEKVNVCLNMKKISDLRVEVKSRIHWGKV